MTTDATGNVTLLNPVAESLTGWAQQVAHGVPQGTVFNALDEETRKPVESPDVRPVRADVLRERQTGNICRQAQCNGAT